MAAWSLTKQEIIDSIENLLRRITGQESPSYKDRKTIDNAFNAALIDLCLDRGISHWRFIQTDDTEDTTANTAYVDLDENIFNIVSGTVRIEADDVTLDPMSIEYNYTQDPDQNWTGRPQFYAVDSSGDAETIRMRLKPIPDAVYTIAFVAESVPDEDSISSFPVWTHACLKDKATMNALLDLGVAEQAPVTMAGLNLSYEKRKQDNKTSQGLDIPRHINRPYSVYRGGSLESRCPD